MRKLEEVHERAFAAGLANDARTAMAYFAVQVGGASVYRTSDSHCHMVIPPGDVREVHVIGHGSNGELLEGLRPMPLDTSILMSKHLYAQLSHLVRARAMKIVELWTGPPGYVPKGMPPPRPDFDVRPVLYSDLPAWQSMPLDARLLHRRYGDPRVVLAKGAAIGAFNGVRIASMATAELGHSFSTLRAFTQPDLRGRGLATHCVAALMDHIRASKSRPLFPISSTNGSPDRAMARRFGFDKSTELAMVMRQDISL
jgi:GNAT superfamily N-acetyltransferase